MFGPDTELLSGRHVIFIDLGHAEALRQARALFAATMAEQVVMGLDEHDRLIAYVLGLSHALNIAFFTALAESGEAAPRLVQLSSTTFDAQFDIASKVAEESPELYYEIQKLNDFGAESLDALARAVETVRSAVSAGDQARFTALMRQGHEYVQGRRDTAARAEPPARARGAQRACRRSSTMNTGAPISAMMAPTGSSRGAASVRLNRSARHSSTPPAERRSGRDDAVIAGAEPQAYEVRARPGRRSRSCRRRSRRARSAPRSTRIPPRARRRRAARQWHCAARPAPSTLSQRPANAETVSAAASASSSNHGLLRPAEVARQPEDHAAQLAGVGQRQHHRDQGTAGAGQHHATKQQSRRSAASRQQQHGEAHDGAAGGGRPVQCHEPQARQHAGQRADGGAAGDAQHERVGQRIAEQRLQQYAGQCQQAARPRRPPRHAAAGPTR